MELLQEKDSTEEKLIGLVQDLYQELMHEDNDERLEVWTMTVLGGHHEEKINALMRDLIIHMKSLQDFIEPILQRE